MDTERLPQRNRDAFHCPDCGVYAAQHWGNLALHRAGSGASAMPGFTAAKCTACGRHSLWRGDAMVYPLNRQGEPPKSDMPDDVQAVHEEARSVAPISRRSAAGLLRLALQMLVDDLEPGEGTIDTKIGALVQRGLDPQVQQAMDVLRVVGNESVHPGQIDLEADDDLVPALFNLLNIIVEQVITRPNHVGGLFGMLPQAKRDAVQRRDGAS